MLSRQHSFTAVTTFLVIASVPACKGFGHHQEDDAGGQTDRFQDGTGSGGAPGGSGGRTGTGGAVVGGGGSGGTGISTGGSASGGSLAATGGGAASTSGSAGTGGRAGTGGVGGGGNGGVGSGGTAGMIQGSGGRPGTGGAPQGSGGQPTGTGGMIASTGGSPAATGGTVASTGGTAPGTGGDQGTGGRGSGGTPGTGGTQPCGNPGQTCCTGQSCASGSFCGSGSVCTACGGPSACCSENDCQQPNPSCNRTTHVCVTCTPPDSAMANQYVNPITGFDDPQHGGTKGLCAYKTLTYALTRARGPIELASGIYGAPAERLPFVLTDFQTIRCFDLVPIRPTLRGVPADDGTGVRSVVKMAGMYNEIFECIIDGIGGYDTGAGKEGACVHVASPGSASINGADIHDCGRTGVSGGPSGLFLPLIQRATIHHNKIGVLVPDEAATSTGGRIDSSVFQSNDTDIYCSSPSPSVSGFGNTNPASGDGKATCTGCLNCPF
jgi:hypothetical protein